MFPNAHIKMKKASIKELIEAFFSTFSDCFAVEHYIESMALVRHGDEMFLQAGIFCVYRACAASSETSCKQGFLRAREKGAYKHHIDKKATRKGLLFVWCTFRDSNPGPID